MSDDELKSSDIDHQSFTHAFRLFGVPKSIVHDKGPQFSSQFWLCYGKHLVILIFQVLAIIHKLMV